MIILLPLRKLFHSGIISVELDLKSQRHIFGLASLYQSTR